MPTNNKPKGDSSSNTVTDPNQVINSTNTQPDYYTDDLSRDKNSDEDISTTATSGLDQVTDEGSELKKEPYVDDIDQVDRPENDPDGPSTLTETARFTDEAGTYERGPNSNPTSTNVNAGNPVHPGVDEDTE